MDDVQSPAVSADTTPNDSVRAGETNNARVDNHPQTPPDSASQSSHRYPRRQRANLYSRTPVREAASKSDTNSVLSSNGSQLRSKRQRSPPPGEATNTLRRSKRIKELRVSLIESDLEEPYVEPTTPIRSSRHRKSKVICNDDADSDDDEDVNTEIVARMRRQIKLEAMRDETTRAPPGLAQAGANTQAPRNETIDLTRNDQDKIIKIEPGTAPRVPTDGSQMSDSELKDEINLIGMQLTKASLSRRRFELRQMLKKRQRLMK
jgi:hypothetical protein